MPPSITTCPNCGKELTFLPDADQTQSAPWACFTCQRGWWPSELTPTARQAWDPRYRDFGPQNAKVGLDIAADKKAARDMKEAKKANGNP